MDDINLSNVNRLYTILLLKSGEEHGYDIIKKIGKVTGKEPSTSHIYPFLNTLEEQGLVSAEETGNRGKKVYSLTAQGEKFVEDRINSFGEILAAAIQDRVSECPNCGCEIYANGYEKNGKTYCCKHCALA